MTLCSGNQEKRVDVFMQALVIAEDMSSFNVSEHSHTYFLEQAEY
jgi:hypothetical protein